MYNIVTPLVIYYHLPARREPESFCFTQFLKQAHVPTLYSFYFTLNAPHAQKENPALCEMGVILCSASTAPDHFSHERIIIRLDY